MNKLNPKIKKFYDLTVCRNGHVLTGKDGKLEWTIICPNCNKRVILGNYCQMCGNRLPEINNNE